MWRKLYVKITDMRNFARLFFWEHSFFSSNEKKKKIHQCLVSIYLEKIYSSSNFELYVLKYQAKNWKIWSKKGHFKEGLQLLHWCSSPVSWKEKAAVVNAVVKASRKLQVWKLFFPSRYFLVLSISYSQPSLFFCNHTHMKKMKAAGKEDKGENCREKCNTLKII